ncbi:MAG TPA: DUF1800 family protein [Solimonas sp.]|nr:DUF1800 family protein [Solimonas sp.]
MSVSLLSSTAMALVLSALATDIAPPQAFDLQRLAVRTSASGDWTHRRVDRAELEKIVDQTLEAASNAPVPEPPDWARKPWDLRRTTPDTFADMIAAKKKRTLYHAANRRWVLESALNSPAPLRERMWLFWMDYFAIHNTDYAPHTVWDLQALHAGALGDYRELLRIFSRSFSAQETLNLDKNRIGHPNENFARELLELYSLGPEYYTQGDVTEIARAFTGWRLSSRTGWFMEWPPWHDYGVKTVLGKSGRLDGDDVLEIIYAHPRFSERLVERMWREFVSPKPDPEAVQRLSRDFRVDYDVRKLLRALLLEPAFWAEENREALVKSPVELVVDSLRNRGVRGDHGAALDAWTSLMGQTLLAPPDVKGWRGYTEWLTVGTLDARLAFSRFLRFGIDASMLSTLSASSSTMLMTVPEEELLASQEALWRALEKTTVTGERNGDEVFMPGYQLK